MRKMNEDHLHILELILVLLEEGHTQKVIDLLKKIIARHEKKSGNTSK